MKLIDYMDHLFEGAYIVDSNRRIIQWNQRAETITGYTSDEVVGNFCYNNILRHMDEEGTLLCHNGCPLAKSIESRSNEQASVTLHHKQGYRVPVNVRVIPMTDESGNTFALELFDELRDDANIFNQYQSLKEELRMDGLTNLYNRRFIDYQIDLSLDELKTFQTPLGVFFIDIDHFKAVNDTYGHDIGDEVLKTIATTLSLNVRPGDYVGRWGGEEFIILTRDITHEAFAQMGERLRRVVAQTSTAIPNDHLRITVSIGGVYTDKSAQRSDLIKRADENMYAAKRTRNQVIITSLDDL